tara:strand:+ start:62 stop:388 length:327 start_codon:yes stop_codon:yes gene_type:complete
MKMEWITCLLCERRFKKNVHRRTKNYCYPCRERIRDGERVACPGCGKIVSWGGASEHAKVCPSSVDPLEIKGVIKSTKESQDILDRNEWTLNKPIEQLNKEYYNGKTD